MEKKFTKFELARFKRTAQNVDQYITKKNKLVTKINELNAELEKVQKMIDLEDAATKYATGGFGTEDIIRKVVTPTDKVDKNGVVLKVTSYEFIYPDTIIPPVMEEVIVPPTTEGMIGSDFDADTEILNNNTSNSDNSEINY